MTGVIVTCRQIFFLLERRLTILRLLLLAGLLIPLNSSANLALNVEKIVAALWQVEGLQMRLNTAADGSEELLIEADSLSYPDQLQLTEVSLHCPRYSLTLSHIECQQARFTARHPEWHAITAVLQFSYQINTQALQIKADQIKFLDSEWQAQIKLDRNRWEASISSQDSNLRSLGPLLTTLHPALQAYALSAGKMQIQAEFSGQADSLQQASIEARIESLDLAATDGINSTQTEKLGFGFRLELQHILPAQTDSEGWQIKADLLFDRGLAYLEPGLKIGLITPGFYLELEPRPVQMDVVMNWFPEQAELEIKSLQLEHRDVMQVESHGIVRLGGLALLGDMHFSVSAPSLPAIYSRWLQPMLLDTAFSQLQSTGALLGEVRVQDNQLTDLAVNFDQVYLEDEQGRFNLYGMQGDLILNSTAIAQSGQLSWQGAGIYSLDLGAAEMLLESSNGQIKLQRGVDIPILDGLFKIDRLEVDHAGQAQMQIYLDGLLTPISLETFSQAMGWPLMKGKLSGIIPGLRFSKHRLSMDGNLLVRAFDGSMPIKGLEITELFGRVPRLEADIELHRLNLETLTSTFSFGKITGQLDGYIHDLKLEAWQPVSFNAAFSNSENDKYPHRISRNAVDDLTSIGGGFPALSLSSRFIKIFDEFGYGELALSCRLHKAVCEMGGVSDSGDTYDILTPGIFPPWIAIKGFNRYVDWAVLLERLQDVVEGETPIIQ